VRGASAQTQMGRCQKVRCVGDQTMNVVRHFLKLDVLLQAMVYPIKQCSYLPLAVDHKQATFSFKPSNYLPTHTRN
jgi:hypothetical protein